MDNTLIIMQSNIYDIIYVSNLPAFYKINLLNEIAKQQKVLAVFMEPTEKSRNKDFISGEMNFDYVLYTKKSVLKRCCSIVKVLYKIEYKQLIICGWDNAEYYIAAILGRKSKNAVVVESSIFESQTSGVKALIKKIFLSQISTAYVSGKYQKKLLEALGFNRKIIVTKGVGIFNIVEQPAFEKRQDVRNFLYVGRLIECKNLKYLIETFNELPHLALNIIGFGTQEYELRQMAKSNIMFIGAINNKDLPKYYRKNDVFILPSISEVWGLVVEEALNNGVPVIVSDRVGCIDEVVKDGENGVIFPIDDNTGLKNAIEKMLNLDYYNHLRKNISQMDFMQIAKEQVRCYIK